MFTKTIFRLFKQFIHDCFDHFKRMHFADDQFHVPGCYFRALDQLLETDFTEILKDSNLKIEALSNHYLGIMSSKSSMPDGSSSSRSDEISMTRSSLQNQQVAQIAPRMDPKTKKRFEKVGEVNEEARKVMY